MKRKWDAKQLNLGKPSNPPWRKAQQLLHEQAAKHADDTARVEATHARTVDMMAHQNGLLQDELDELKKYQKQYDLRADGSKPKAVGDTRED